MAVPVKPITYGLLALGVISWVVFLAGIAVLHKFFADIPAATFQNGKTLFLHSLLGYSWWAVWAMFVMLAASIVATVMGKLREASRVLGLMATATFVMNSWVCDSTSVYRTINNQIEDLLDDSLEAKFDVWLAGSVMSTATAAILMLWMGSLDMFMDAPARKDVPMMAARYADSSAGVGPSAYVDGPASVRIHV